MMEKTVNQKAWFLVLPVLVLVALPSCVIPLMTVVNYSVQDSSRRANTFFGPGFDWFATRCMPNACVQRWVGNWRFSLSSLLIEIPLGIMLARNMPKEGRWSSVLLVLIAVAAAHPAGCGRHDRQIFARGDIGPLGYTLTTLGIDYNYTQDFLAAWLTIMRWTSGTGPRSWPAGVCRLRQFHSHGYYQAATIDHASRWPVFRHIEFPQILRGLMIARPAPHGQPHDLHRTPRRHRWRAGQYDHLPVQYLVKMAVGQFDLGPAAAFSLCTSW